VKWIKLLRLGEKMEDKEYLKACIGKKIKLIVYEGRHINENGTPKGLNDSIEHTGKIIAFGDKFIEFLEKDNEVIYLYNIDFIVEIKMPDK
jgi:hypothetical protein